MRERAAFAYVQSRLQAHQGRRPTQSTWQFLNSSRTLGHYLESARQTALAPYVTNLTANSDIHVIERNLRTDWRAYVDKVALWLPAEWRPAVRWVGQLVDLPFLADNRRKPDSETTAADESRASVAGWLERFQHMLPRAKGPHADDIEALLFLLRRHLSLDNPELRRDSVEARYRLIAALEKVFRRKAQRPVAVFAFLSMSALDMEHLRAHLVHRCLFPETLDNR